MRRRRQAHPSTLIGQYLRASVLRQEDLRESLKQELDQRGWHDADEVVTPAFNMVVQHAFTPGNTVSVTDLVTKMREHFSTDGVNRVPQDEGELLTRQALGESVDTGGIPVKASFSIRALMFVGLAWSFGYDEATLDRILAHAEHTATSRGFAPLSLDPPSA